MSAIYFNVLSLILLFFFSPIQSQPINPQPGENIWHLMAQVGTEVDQIALMQNSCCVGTFTTLHDIESKIDSIVIDSTCDLSGTYTMLNSIVIQNITIESNIDGVLYEINEGFTSTFTQLAEILNENTTLGTMLDQCCRGLGSDVQNVSALIITTASKIDICCATLGSQIDQLTNIMVNSFNGTFTAIEAISTAACDLSATNSLLSIAIAQEITTQSKLDVCCDALSSKIEAINCSTTVDLSGTYTLLNTAIAQEFTTQSKLDLCCVTLNSTVDSLTNIVNADFAGTFTAIAAIPAANFTGTYTVLNTILGQEVVTQSKIDLCCATLNSKVDSLTNMVNADFAGTFTAIAAIPAANFTGTYTVLNTILGQEVVTQSKIDLCCATLNSKVDSLTNMVNADFAGTFTAIAAIPAANFTGTYTVLNSILGQEGVTQSMLDNCCVSLSAQLNTIEMRIEAFTGSNIDALVGTFTTLISLSDLLVSIVEDIDETAMHISTTLAELESLLENVVLVELSTQSKLDVCCATLLGQEVVTQSKIDLCCATLNSKVDSLTNMVNADFAGTFTAIAAIPAANFTGTYTVLNTILGQEVVTQSKIDLCCATLNSKVDSLTNIVNTDFAGTFTAIAAIPATNLSGTYTVLNTILGQEVVTQSKIDLCCATLNSKVDLLTNITVADFAGTFTAIAAIPAANFTGTYTVLNTILGQEVVTQSKIDLCCATLNSKVDLLTNIVNADFAGTFTAIAAIPAANFTGTYTVLNTILGQEVTTQSKIDLCCATLNSKVDSLTNIVNADFAGTFTAIAAIPATNFTGTYTVLNALGLCNATPLTVLSSGTTITASGVYCLTNDVTLGTSNLIAINAANVVLDLNNHTISSGSTTQGAIVIGADRVTVKNGSIVNNSFGGVATSVATRSNIVVSNVSVTNCARGFANNGQVVNLTLDTITTRNCSIAGIYLSGGVNYLINNCRDFSGGGIVAVLISNCILKGCSVESNGSGGFTISQCTDVTVDSCYANNCSIGFVLFFTGNQSVEVMNSVAQMCVNGFDLSSNIQSAGSASLKNCNALLNSNTGFSLACGKGVLENCSSTNNTNTGFIFNNGSVTASQMTLSNCQAIANGTHGFDLSSSTSCSLSYCSASNNGTTSGSGFNLNGASTCLITNCQAESNTIDGFDASLASACCIIGDCIASGNTSYGFVGNANVTFFNNFAQCNTLNFDDTSASSAMSGMLDSKIDALTNIVNTDFAGTYSLLNEVLAQEAITQDEIAICCSTLNSKVDVVINYASTISSKIDEISGGSCDFTGTYSLLNEVLAQEAITQNEIAICCSTLNSKVDSLTNIVNADFAGTFSAIAAIPAANFTGTYTVLNTILGQEVTTQSKVDLCCATLNSKIDLLNTTVVNDFAGTFTVLQQGMLCAPTPIYGVTTITTAGSYCLAKNFIASSGDAITINANDVILDLNNKTITGAGANNGVHIMPGIRRAIIKNGQLYSMAQNGLLIDSANQCSVSNCRFINSSVGLSLYSATDNIIQDNNALLNTYAGYYLVASANNIVKNCNAIDTFSSTGNAYGFVAAAGHTNLFENCNAESTYITVTGSGYETAGFLLTTSEACSKIINCKADTTQTPTFGSSIPYGIKLGTSFNGAESLIQSIAPGVAVLSLDWSPNGQYVAAGVGASVSIYSLSGQALSLVTTYTTATGVQSVKWSPNGQYVAVGKIQLAGTTDNVQVYQFNGSALTLLPGTVISRGASVNSVDWAPNGQYLAIGSNTPTDTFQVVTYSFNGTSLTAIPGASVAWGNSILSVDWSPNGSYLAICGQDPTGTVLSQIYSFNGSTLTALPGTQYSNNSSQGNCYRWSPSGNYLIFTANSLNVSTLADTNNVVVLAFNGASVSIVASTLFNPTGGANIQAWTADWSPNGQFIAVGGLGTTGQNTAKTYSFSANALNVISALPITTFTRGIGWSPSGAYLATGSNLDTNSIGLRLFQTNSSGPLNCLIKNNIVNCTSGANSAGVGISFPSINSNNIALNNASYQNDINFVNVNNPNDDTGMLITIGSKLDMCCLTLNSKLDALSGISFAGTFTMLQRIDNDVLTVSSKVDTLANSFKGTFTAIAAVSTLITNDFNSTFTAINALNILTTSDFNGTFTVLAQAFACGPTPLYQSNFSNGILQLANSGTDYCFAQNLTGGIIISAPQVTVDLAMHSLIGTFSVLSADATIKNGNILPPAPISTSDLLNAGVFISSAASGALVRDCRVECTATSLTGVNGRNAMHNSGNNSIITDCYINAGAGGPAAAGITAGNGGIGINNIGANAQIKNSKIQSNNGGNGVYFLYVAGGSNSTNVVPVNLSNNSIGSNIPMGGNVSKIAITPNGQTAYVVNYGNNTVIPVTIATNTAGTPIALSSPTSIAITPDGQTAYVTNSSSNTVTPITIATNTVGTSITGLNGPQGIAITPDGKTAYVVNFNNNTVTPITLATSTLGTPITVGSFPQAIAITPNGQTAYVANLGSNNVTPITIATNIAGTPITVGTGPKGIAITPDGKTAYVANGSSSNVTPITIATNTAGAPITVGGGVTGSIAITPDGTTAYVGISSTIIPITIATNTTGSPIAVTNPQGLAITSFSGGTGGIGIQQQANFGQIVATVVKGSAAASAGGTIGDGIVTTANASSNVIDRCTVFNSANGFNVIGSNDIRITDCISQGCIADGFIATSSATAIAVDHCTSMLNGNNGFNFAAAGTCCSVGNSSAISNTSAGFTGTGSNVFFYSNFANCNGNNFDNNSASSAISGKLDSKVDALANNFNSTFTTIAAISTLITNDFNGTFTALSQGFACGGIPLYQSNVVNGSLLLTSTGANYCLTQNITGTITISASNVTLNLNNFNLTGIVSITGSASNSSVINGSINPAAPVSTTDAAQPAILVASSANNALIQNVSINCANSTVSGTAGRDGIDNFASNTIIRQCVIQAGAGANGATATAGTNGGIGIASSGANLQAINCTITTGAGGVGGASSSTSTAAGAGGNGGMGINSSAANAMITNCAITTGNGASGGNNTAASFAGVGGGAGGNGGIGITSTGTYAQIVDCSIITGAGGVGGNSSGTGQNFGGQGGAGGNGIAVSGATSQVLECYIVAGAGNNAGTSSTYGNNGGNAGSGIVLSGSASGFTVQSCIIRLNPGGNAGPTLASANNVASGGIGGDGIVVSGAVVDLIANCDIAGATTALNNGGVSYATGARGGHGINVVTGQVNTIVGCTISSLGYGGASTQTVGNGSSVTAGNGGNGIEIDSSVGAVRNCSISYLGAGGNVASSISAGTATAGNGGTGINTIGIVGVIEGCVISVTGNGGIASGTVTGATLNGGAGGAGIATATNSVAIIENCKVNRTSNGGAASTSASGNTTTVTSGAAGIGFNINSFSLIMKNCLVSITGTGGTASGAGTLVQGSGGIGINIGASSGGVELIECSVERTSPGSGTIFSGHAYVVSANQCYLDSCSANSINGDGYRIASTAANNTIRNCAATFCQANGFNASASGSGNVIEKCIAVYCQQPSTFGFASQNNSNTVFLLNEGRNNTRSFDTANITAANGSFPPVSMTVGGNYGANLMGNGNA